MDALESNLQSILTPVTQNLPKPIRDLGISLLGNHCYKTLIYDVQISDSSCLKLAISKGLGIGIIGASATVKIPQLLKLINSQSAAGISFLSYLLETASYLVSLAYNARQGFPFSTYGETALIAVQNVAIAVLVLQYSGKGPMAAVYIAGLAAAGYALFSANVIDMQTLGYLQAGAGAVGVASKLPQILTIWSEGGTGQLSAFAVFNYLVGSLTRIFTTLQEVDDKLILYGFISGFILNAVLATQMIYHWNSPASSASASKPKKLTGKKHPGHTVVASPAAARSSGAEGKGKSPSTRRRG
ncbi:hypothetical protein AAFC00_002144 [Neodothiora populina]|uniref:Mannose-P-dolichol utilization defect 1 protein homolog n=1 Tax=Neodothiora populina TaxID=2781224 RepID=A0ABR3PGP5_9PEZI